MADDPRDEDLVSRDDRELFEEVVRLRKAIRQHRDEKGHNRCWLDDQRLYSVLPESEQADFALPPKPEFLQQCEAYWENRCPRNTES